MVRFSIEDDASPVVCKRPRCSEPPSQSYTSADEDEELIPMESDSQGEEEEEEEDEFEPEDEEEEEEDVPLWAYFEATEPVPDVAVPNLNSSTASPVINNGNEELQVVLTDPDVLDCPICFNPLCSPVFQCENGHIACSSCCSNVNRECPSCYMPIGYNRCRAIEKVIESVKISCKNAQYGCTKTMFYNKKNKHERICPHAVCFCPRTCPFSGNSRSLYLHFGIHHAASTTRFTYNTTFTLRLERYQKLTALQEQNESVIFILNQEAKIHGDAFNLDCVGPSSLKNSFRYKLSAKSSKAILSLHGVPEVYAKWSEHRLNTNYLTVLSDFPRCKGALSINVLIKKVRSSV